MLNEQYKIPRIEFDNSFAMEFYRRSMNVSNKIFDCKKTPYGKEFVTITSLLDSYRFWVNITLVKEVFAYKNTLNCFAEKFQKKEGVYENNRNDAIQLSGRKVKFLKENDYTISFKEHGYYYIICYSQDIFWKKKIIFQEIYTVLPDDMSKIKKPNEAYQKNKVNYLIIRHL